MFDLPHASSPEKLWELLKTLERPDNLIRIAPRFSAAMRIKGMQALALDFDHTAAIGGHHPLTLDHLAGPELLERLKSRQRAHTDDMDLSQPDPYFDNRDSCWIGDNIGIWVDGKRTQAQFQEAGRSLKLRAGVKELVDFYGSHKSVVISMGIKPIIQAALQAHEVHCEVVATELHFVEEILQGHLPDQPIFTGSLKGRALERFCATHGLSTTDCLVVGDSYGDRKLFEVGGVRVFMIPTTEAGEFDLRPYRVQAIQRLWPQIDLMVTDTLLPLYQFVSALGR